MHRAITTMLMLGLLVSVVVFGTLTVKMRADIERGRLDMKEHVKAALYYMKEFDRMRSLYERSNSSRVARQVEGVDGN